MSSLLERMRDIMDKEGITPKRLTETLGISNSSFTDWGKGKGSPSVMVLTKFAEYFNVSLDYLVFGNEFDVSKSDFSYVSAEDQELLNKFHSLPLEHQMKLMGYIDGMLTAMNDKINI